MKKRLDLWEGAILSVIIFGLLAYFLPGRGMDDLVLALLSVSSFLFGIFVAFSISDRHSRQKEMRETLKMSDANILNLYQLSKVMNKNIHKKIQKLIDNWLTSTLDYFLKDHHKTDKNFHKLYLYVLNIKPETKKQSLIYGEMISHLTLQTESNKRVRYLAQDKITVAEWTSILILAGIILFSLFYINTNTIFSILLVTLLSTTLVTILLVLRDLDALYWKEQKWIWDPLTSLFKEIDLLPYFPQEVINNGRVKIKKGLKYRSATYPKPYPDLRGKKVKIRIS
tara:strand:+ start:524 stop:1372 length:849 start_codon:yes stop_codon:yes gene_type:complete